jgi:hypothetical protein
MTMDYQPEHILGSMFELRDNQRIERFVSKTIEREDWSSVIEILKRARELDVLVPGWDIPLRKGVLRDGMMELLRLNDFVGLDVDFVDAFADLEVNSIGELRTQAREKAMELIEKQVKRGLTFFMDLESMADTELAVYVPSALEARVREVQKLGDSPHLYEIYSTYYGFKILTSGIQHEDSGVPEETRESLLKILGDIGDVSIMSSKQLKFSPLAFARCSGHLIVLLWNMLRLSVSGHRYRIKALSNLAELGDSRVLPFLYSIYDSLPPSMILEPLCKIGHPSSFEFLVQRSLNLSDRDTLPLVSQIRHPGVVNLIEHEMDKVSRLRIEWQVIPIIKSAGNTRLRMWIPFYESLENHRSNRVRKAVAIAQRNMHPPFYDEQPV